MALKGTIQKWPEQRMIGQPLLFFQAEEQSHALDAENKTGEAQRPRVSGNQGAPQSGQACSVWIQEHSPCPPGAQHKRDDLAAAQH